MYRNRRILNDLFATQQINLTHSPIFDTAPPAIPPSCDFNNVEGMLLGLAIGDALGNATEGQLWQQRHARHGEIRDYLLKSRSASGRWGYPSDDTQLAFWTIEQMLADGEFNPEHLAARFCADKIFGIGSTVSQFLNNYTHNRLPWYQCGVESAGNGALMRIAPILLPHLTSATPDLWVDTALAAMLTHNDAGSTAACIAFVHMLWHLLQMETPPDPSWWLATYTRVAQALEGDTLYRCRGGAFPDYEGPIWKFASEQVGAAYRQGLTVQQACDRWHSGAYLLETVPCVLFILTRHGDNLQEALVRAVNDTRDNDTIAAIVGAAVGALHGRRAIPVHWIANLSGRTTYHDDGHVFNLITQARQVWWRFPTNPTTTPDPPRPIEGCYWVQPGHLLAGEYPRRASEWQARHNLQYFLDAGVTFFLDLTEEDESLPYDTILAEEADARNITVVHRRIPVRDFSIPTLHLMQHILDTIDTALHHEHMVYVHCWFGTGRTGTVIGCHLVRHGMSGPQALVEIARRLADTPKSDLPSPATEEQQAMVLTWHQVDPKRHTSEES